MLIWESKNYKPDLFLSKLNHKNKFSNFHWINRNMFFTNHIQKLAFPLRYVWLKSSHTYPIIFLCPLRRSNFLFLISAGHSNNWLPKYPHPTTFLYSGSLKVPIMLLVQMHHLLFYFPYIPSHQFLVRSPPCYTLQVTTWGYPNLHWLVD